jgi:Rieske Fe-S protein
MRTQEHDEHDALDANIDRRSLLGGGLVGLTTLVVGCGGTTPSGGDFGPADAAAETGPDPDASPMDAAETCAPAQCTDDANTLVVDLSKHPGLAKTGGSVTLTDSRYVDPFCGQSQFIVAQPTAEKFIALSASCTHSCCLVSFTGHGFFCPCHGSTFDLTGKVTGGPANGPLAQVPVCADGCGKLYLTLK